MRPTSSALLAGGRLPPVLNTLQIAWLRELGMPRVLLPAVVESTGVAQAEGDVKADQRASADRRSGHHPAEQVSGCAVADPQGDPARVRLAAVSAVPRGAAHMTQLHAGTAASHPPPEGARRFAPATERAAYVRVPGAIEKALLADLRTMVDTCEGCALSATRRHTVFGVGPEKAAWMVVGEAPGEHEDLQGQPFVGKSGQLLTQMLRAVGVEREIDVFIANVIKCRPPGNRNPKPEEIAECRPFLMRQIELVAPQRLLVLGRFAAQVLVGADANLNALRGKTHTFTGSDGRQIPMIVSFHPAYLLRSPQEKAKAWRDLRLAAALG